jgi:hypothetical protein
MGWIQGGVELVWNRWMRAEVVEPVGWKANWSEKFRPGGGEEGGINVIMENKAL